MVENRIESHGKLCEHETEIYYDEIWLNICLINILCLVHDDIVRACELNEWFYIIK